MLATFNFAILPHGYPVTAFPYFFPKAQSLSFLKQCLKYIIQLSVKCIRLLCCEK